MGSWVGDGACAWACLFVWWWWCCCCLWCRAVKRRGPTPAPPYPPAPPPRARAQVCDLSSLASIRELAEAWGAAPLHLLICNAGLMVHEREASAEGYELNFAVNTLGTLALVLALEPALLAAAPAARVVLVSSGGQYTAPLVVDDLEGKRMRKFDGTVQYARDKRRQLALGERLAARWAGAGVGVYAMHPGWTETEGVKKSIPGFYNTFKARLRNLAQGCDTTVWLCLEDAAKLQPGAFYLDRAPQPKHLPLAGTQYTEADAARLWDVLVGMLQPALPVGAPAHAPAA